MRAYLRCEKTGELLPCRIVMLDGAQVGLLIAIGVVLHAWAKWRNS